MTTSSIDPTLAQEIDQSRTHDVGAGESNENGLNDANHIPHHRCRQVLHLINGEHYSGAERVQDLLALGLPRWNYRVAFACVKPGKFPQARISKQVPLFSAEMRSRFDIGSVRRLRDLVTKNDYSLLHAHTPRTALVGSLLSRWCRIPLVYHVHSPVGRDSTNSLRNVLNGFVESISLGSAHQLITVSHSLATYMGSLGVPASRISIVPNGVPTPIRQRDPSPPNAPWTIGTVALFRPRKGTEILIDAIALLREQGIPIRMRAVGGFETASYEKFLRDRVRERDVEDCVEWVGFTQDVNHELCQMDAFVLPSLFGEGLPMVVLEAMAAGVPVIGTQVEGVPEAIRHGEEGLLARPGDPQDLAGWLRSLILGEHNWSALRQRAQHRHATKFSDTAMCNGVAAVYDRVLSSTP